MALARTVLACHANAVRWARRVDRSLWSKAPGCVPVVLRKESSGTNDEDVG
jgi:hypothetical protein